MIVRRASTEETIMFWNQSEPYQYSQGIAGYANVTDNDLRITPIRS